MTPIGSYLLSSDITMAEKTSEKTTSIATYNTPVAQAAESSLRPELCPPSRIHIVSHQKPVAQTRPAAASSTGPPAWRSPGPAQPVSSEVPISTASHASRRGMSFIPRCGTSKARSYTSWSAVAAAIPPSTKNTIDAVPTTALAVAADGANR